MVRVCINPHGVIYFIYFFYFFFTEELGVLAEKLTRYIKQGLASFTHKKKQQKNIKIVPFVCV